MSDPLTPRKLSPSEIPDALYFLTSYAFHPSPPLQDQEEWLEALKQRQDLTGYAVYEELEPLCTCISTDMRQNVRGREFPMGGIWGVATHPRARRQGYAKQNLAALLKDNREEGLALSMLYPFRESFYERLGYITFPQPKKVTFKTKDLAPLLRLSLEGTVEMMPFLDGFDRFQDYLEPYFQNVHGMSLLKTPLAPRVDKNQYWLATALQDGKITGVMLYRLKGEEITRFTFYARRFYTSTSEAKYLFLNWIARHIDQAENAELWLPPFERPETWLSDLNVETRELWIPPMGRVLDVKSLNGLPAGPGAFTACISDPICPWNEGCWSFESAGEQLVVHRAEQADLNLSIQGLSAVVYGTHAVEDFPFRTWGNPDASHMKIVREMFPLQLPYLHLFF